MTMKARCEQCKRLDYYTVNHGPTATVLPRNGDNAMAMTVPSRADIKVASTTDDCSSHSRPTKLGHRITLKLSKYSELLPEQTIFHIIFLSVFGFGFFYIFSVCTV